MNVIYSLGGGYTHIIHKKKTILRSQSVTGTCLTLKYKLRLVADMSFHIHFITWKLVYEVEELSTI